MSYGEDGVDEGVGVGKGSGSVGVGVGVSVGVGGGFVGRGSDSVGVDVDTIGVGEGDANGLSHATRNMVHINPIIPIMSRAFPLDDLARIRGSFLSMLYLFSRQEFQLQRRVLRCFSCCRSYAKCTVYQLRCQRDVFRHRSVTFSFDLTREIEAEIQA